MSAVRAYYPCGTPQIVLQEEFYHGKQKSEQEPESAAESEPESESAAEPEREPQIKNTAGGSPPAEILCFLFFHRTVSVKDRQLFQIDDVLALLRVALGQDGHAAADASDRRLDELLDGALRADGYAARQVLDLG